MYERDNDYIWSVTEAAAWVKNDSAIQTKGEGLTPNWERICEGP